VEGNSCKTPIFAEQRPGEGQRRVELGELVVDRDADRLERALCRVAAAEARRRGNRGRDDVDELVRCLDRLARAGAHDRAGDLRRVALLTQLAQDARELALVPRVHHGRRVELLVGIHPHVQRRVPRVGEAALGGVDLHRGHPEVEVDHVGPLALLAQLREALGERRPDEARVARQLGRELGEALLGDRVAVDRDQRDGRPEAPGDQPRVTARAERAVDCGLARLRIEHIDELGRENRYVVGGHLNQHGRGSR